MMKSITAAGQNNILILCFSCVAHSECRVIFLFEQHVPPDWKLTFPMCREIKTGVMSRRLSSLMDMFIAIFKAKSQTKYKPSMCIAQ